MEDFDYPLPPEAVAQVPLEPRDSARLLDATDPGGHLVHRRVADLADLMGPGDLLVINETRVMAARLLLTKASGGRVEVLLLEEEPSGSGRWRALVKPGRRLAPATELLLDGETVAVIEERSSDGLARIRLIDLELPARAGQIPLPPYIHQPLADPSRYQTVYARRPGSAAAPTAGLHLTQGVLEAVSARGARIATVDLSVGLDTFRPLSPGPLDGHVMHSERYSVPEATMEAIESARRVVAVGTTTVRALESAHHRGCLEGRTDLFITPGFAFGVVDVLMTNFHVPRSTLLVMLEAFCGARWRTIYDEALAEGYRFLSFGDAMIVSRADR